MKISPKLFFALFFGAFYAVLLPKLLVGIVSARQSVLASDWPSTQGTVLSLGMGEQSAGSGSRGRVHGVEIEYRYSVDGTTYTNDRLAFGYRLSSTSLVHSEILQALENSSSVAVRYNPNKPEVSTLSFGIHNSIKLVLIFGTLWFIFISGMASSILVCFGVSDSEFEKMTTEVQTKLMRRQKVRYCITWMAGFFAFVALFVLEPQSNDVLIENLEVTPQTQETGPITLPVQ